MIHRGYEESGFTGPIGPDGSCRTSPIQPLDSPLMGTERETVQYHDSLNPAVWDGFHLKPGIREALLKIAEDFISTWKFDIPVRDIILTGSNASYNWTKYSDFDVHVVVNMRLVPDASAEFVKSLLSAKKTLWNSRHTVSVKGYDVEVYAQDTDEILIAAGVFSLRNGAWNSMPEAKTPVLLHPCVITKAQQLADEIDAAALSPDEAELRFLLQEIADLRKSGLQRAGEFSVENLAFKVLRNSGHIRKLRDTLSTLIDQELSVEQTILPFGEFMAEHLTAGGRYKKQRTLTRNRWKLKRRSRISLATSGSSRRLARRSHQAARRAITKKILGLSPTQKTKLTSTQKLEVERIIKRRAGSLINPLKTRGIPVSQVRDRKRLTKRYGYVKRTKRK